MSESYKIVNKLGEGTYTNVFVCDDGITLLKVIKDANNNALLAKEAEIIGELKSTNLAELFPDLLDTTEVALDVAGDISICDNCPDRFVCFTTTVSRHKECTRKNNALVYRYDKDMPSLLDVMKAYPKGIDERDMVWMYKRLLAAIWTAHSIGVIHSAVLPEHILLDLKTHGIWLIDWMHTNKVGKKPKVLELTSKNYYPEYKLTAENATALDIHMAAVCMTDIMGGLNNVSKNIRLILRACTMGATEAKEVHEQLDKEVKKLYGSIFRPFKV